MASAGASSPIPRRPGAPDAVRASPRPVALPALLGEIAAAEGLEAALRLAQCFGGLSVKVPKRARADHPVARLCGHSVLLWLVRERGGERVQVPMGPRHPDRVRAAHRLAEVARRTGRGESAADISRALVIHERHVVRLRALAVPDDRQAELEL